MRTANFGLFLGSLLVCSCILGQTPTTGTTATQPGSSDQTQPQTPPTSPAAPVPSTPPAPAPYSWTTVGKVNFAGYVDFYGSFNDNHPSTGFNNLYNFNDKTNQVNLNMAKITASMDPAPVGFRFDIGLGRAFDIFHTPKANPEFFDYVEQAYVSFKPKHLKGFEADFGDFVTSAGAEVIESKDNWNYSRSLLFSFAIPYNHFGIRTSLPIGSSVTVGLQVVDGWNYIVAPPGINFRTFGITGALTRKKYTWSHDYYVGPMPTYISNVKHDRQLYDTTLLLTPNDKLNAYLNFDYGQQRTPTVGHDHWIGFAGAVHYQINKYFAVSPRGEYYNDTTGFTTGVPQKLKEVTVTGEYKILSGLLTRLEYRHDNSNVPFFDRGGTPSSSKNQTTVSLGVIVFFPPPKT